MYTLYISNNAPPEAQFQGQLCSLFLLCLGVPSYTYNIVNWPPQISSCSRAVLQLVAIKQAISAFTPSALPFYFARSPLFPFVIRTLPHFSDLFCDLGTYRGLGHLSWLMCFVFFVLSEVVQHFKLKLSVQSRLESPLQSVCVFLLNNYWDLHFLSFQA